MAESNCNFKSLDWESLLRKSSEEECDSDETFCDEIDTVKKQDVFHSCDYDWKTVSEENEEEMSQTILADYTEDQLNSAQSSHLHENSQPLRNVELQLNCERNYVDYEREPYIGFSEMPHLDKQNHAEGNATKNYTETNLTLSNTYTEAMSCTFQFTPFNENIDYIGVKDEPYCSSTQFMAQSGLNHDNVKGSLQYSNSFNNEQSGFNEMTILDDSRTVTFDRKNCTTQSPKGNTTNKENAFKQELFQLSSTTTSSGCGFISDLNRIDIGSGSVHNEIENYLLLSNTDGENLPRSQLNVEDDMAMQTDDVFLEGLSQNLTKILEENDAINAFLAGGGIPAIKPCSPPLTLSKGYRRSRLPAEKVLPKYSKKHRELAITKKVLPVRRCVSSYIDISSRANESDKKIESCTSIEETSNESATVKDLTLSLIKKNKKITKEENKENVDIKPVQNRAKKTSVKKIRKGKTSRNPSPTKKLTDNSVVSLTEMETVLEQVEARVSRWLSGTDTQPPSREQAFQMLSDTQLTAQTLQQLYEKTVGRKRRTRSDERKAVKLLMEKSNQLAVTIDRAISEADRLMAMELNQNSQKEDNCQTNLNKIVQSIKNNPKPILKYSSTSSENMSESSKVDTDKHISFSDDVECHYLSSSCSGQSSLSYKRSPCEEQSNGDKEEQVASDMVYPRQMFGSNTNPNTNVSETISPTTNKDNLFAEASPKRTTAGLKCHLNPVIRNNVKKSNRPSDSKRDHTKDKSTKVLTASSTADLDPSKTPDLNEKGNGSDTNYGDTFSESLFGVQSENESFVSNTHFKDRKTYGAQRKFDCKPCSSMVNSNLPKRQLNTAIVNLNTAERSSDHFTYSLKAETHDQSIPKTSLGRGDFNHEKVYTRVSVIEEGLKKVSFSPKTDTMSSDSVTENENSFSFSETTPEEEETLANFSIMSIKAIRIKDPDEFYCAGDVDSDDFGDDFGL